LLVAVVVVVAKDKMLPGVVAPELVQADILPDLKE
jgi:hypothetical protein